MLLILITLLRLAGTFKAFVPAACTHFTGPANQLFIKVDHISVCLCVRKVCSYTVHSKIDFISHKCGFPSPVTQQ